MVERPTLIPIDVDMILKDYQKVRENAEISLGQLDATFADAARAAGAGAGAALEVGRATVDVNTILETAAIKLKGLNAKSSAALGTNQEASTYVITALGEKLRQGLQQELKARDSLIADASVGFLDNPAEWLINQISMPFDAAALETVADQNDRIVANMGRLQQLTLEQSKINASVADASSTELLDAKNRLALATARERAAASSAAVARLGIEKLSMRRALTADQFDTTYRLFNVVQAANNQNMEIANFEFRQNVEKRAEAAHEADQKLKDIRLKVAENDLASMQELQSRLDRVTPLLNMRSMKLAEYNAMSDSNPIKILVNTLLFSQDLEFGRLASDPVDAIDKLSVLPNVLPPMQEAVRQALVDIRGAVISQNEVTWKALPPDAKKNKIITAIMEKLKLEANNVPETGSIYSPPPLMSVVSLGALAQNPIIMKLQSIAVNPTYATKASDIIKIGQDLIAAQIASGNPREQVVAAVAENIAQIYKAIMMNNSELRAYNKFALPSLNMSTGYKTAVPATSAIGMPSKDIVDLANPAAITAYLTRKLVREQILRDSVGIPAGVP